MKIRAWLTQDQAVWDYALEVCRRVNGADLDVGHCLELIAGEFIATYAHRAYQFEETECGEGTLAEEQQQDVAIRAGARRLLHGLRHWAGGG